MREASAKQRKALIESNPSLHLSLTRLSIRNIPRTVTSKDLKSLAREAVVGFATDVKAGTRQKLSKEELARGSEDMGAAEKARKKAGKGIVKQAKVVFEGVGGGKVEEASGAGRSRGYGFIEYYTHRNALMGLRWLNGHAVGYQVKDEKRSKTSKEQMEDRKKRLIVEFAIENAQVVMRRKDREKKAGADGKPEHNAANPEVQSDLATHGVKSNESSDPGKRGRGSHSSQQGKHQTLRQMVGGKLKNPSRQSKDASAGKLKNPLSQYKGPQRKLVDEKLARRNQIIGRKRAIRRARKGAKQ